MTVESLLRPEVIQARQRLDEGRQRIRERHDHGSPGIQVCRALCDLLDQTILDLYQAALADLFPKDSSIGDEIALVVHGGFGRQDVAPYSDVDLMILHPPHRGAEIEPLVQRLFHNAYDVKLDVGHSVRTVDEACRLALENAATWTSLAESRLLAGSGALFEQFQAAFRQVTDRRRRRLRDEVQKARDAERRQFGETVFLLEPNVKQSQGGLRDLQLLRWIGFLQYGAAEPDDLQMQGNLTPDDARALRSAHELLLRVRNELHFHSGKHEDVLVRSEQLRIAEVFGYQGEEGLLPVEQFMRDYFRATSTIYSVASRFVEGASPRSRWLNAFNFLVRRKYEGDFTVGIRNIAATPRGLEKMKTDASEVLRLVNLANLFDKKIDYATSEAIRRASPQLPDQITRETAERFMSLLSQPARQGELLRFLRDTCVLEKIIPEFGHARGLLQFNEYHRYTVDEHSIRAVEQGAELSTDQGPVGRALRKIKDRGLLHLALLIHDLGKGYPQDHSELGREIAGRLAERLFLAEHETEVLKFLVHKHLVMSHLAFRRDLNDNDMIVRFASDVGSGEMLRMLYVLTVCDISAVGPGVWNRWKAEMMHELYRKTMQRLTGDDTATAPEDVLAARRAEVFAALKPGDDRAWFERQIKALPASYLQSMPVPRVLEDLCELQRIGVGEVTARGRWLPETKTVEYTVGTHEDVAAGIFYRLTGALSAKGLKILSADINTLADGLVLDRFFVLDPDFNAAPDEARLESVERGLIEALKAEAGTTPTFRRVWNPGAKDRSQILNNLPTRVHTDVTISEHYTVIDVFAADCTGLLYTITRTLFELGLSVAVAKIGTYLDQVVDVFYVTDLDNRKVESPERLLEIESRLLHAIETHSRLEAERVAAQ